MATHIQWTDESWNPVTGCTKVSPGCAHCYAERLAPRVFAGQTVVVTDANEQGVIVGVTSRPRRFTDVRCHPERLDAPLRWRKPRRVFVNSMSDLFHEDVPDEFIYLVFCVMARAGQHTFQVLTKRPERMRDFATRILPSIKGQPDCVPALPLPNVWLGVSVEDQRRADERIPVLLDTPAAVRFLSCEPLLGSVDLGGIGGWLDCNRWCDVGPDADPRRDAPWIDWLIAGGESGPKARPMDLAWARSLVEQGRAAGVPVFVKQLGARPLERETEQSLGGAVIGTTSRDLRLRHRAGGDPDEWPADLRVREFPR